MNDLTIYDKVRDDMKTGDLLQWKSNSIVGALIRWRTKSDVNHSSMVLRLSEYELLERRCYTQEALEHGVVMNLLSRRLEQHDGNAWWYPLKDTWNQERQFIGERILNCIGLPYDYNSIVKQIFGKVSIDAHAFFCSELVYAAWGYEGVAPNPGELSNLKIFKDCVQLI